MPPTDPKDIITPYAFRVEPRLLGMPIARPFRRGLAMLADLLVLSILLLLREMSGALLGLVIAWVLFRISGKRGEAGVEGPVARPVLRISAFVVLFVSVALMLQSCFGIVERRTASPAAERAVRQADTGVRAGEAAGLVAALARMAATGDSSTSQAAADRLAATLARSGVARSEREEVLRELMRADQGDWRASVARVAVDRSVEAETEANRTGARPGRDPGIRAFLGAVAEDLGIGIGWAGIYFTIFTVLMGGRTPGKRLLGIRVVRLNGEPLGWWASFSRFGGYAAGLATGLVGFLQVYWDANRQGIHDKIVGTVVVLERGRSGHGTAGSGGPASERRAAGPAPSTEEGDLRRYSRE